MKNSKNSKNFRKFKKSHLHVGKDNCKETRNEVQKLILAKKSKLTENIGKLKELWKC